MAIKVCHMVWMPVNGKCGLYGTTKDLVKAERLVGLDAQVLNCDLSDPTKFNHDTRTDGWLTSISLEEAKTADVFVEHSAIPKPLRVLHKPIICCIHGRPESTFLTSRNTDNKIHHIYNAQMANPDYKAFVSFWKEYAFAFGLDYPKNKLWFVNAPCDTEEFIPEGPKYDFGKNSGKPNIVIADIWRDDVTPFNAVMAATEFLKTYAPGGKLHIFGIEKMKHGATQRLLNGLIKTGVIGCIGGIMPNMAEIFRAADFVVTPHVISTRIVREATSCGCPVIRPSCNVLNTHDFSEQINSYCEMAPVWEDTRGCTRSKAVDSYNLKTVGEQMKKVIESVVVPTESIWDKHGRIFNNPDNFGKRTICENHRRLHDLLILSKNDSLIKQLDPLLEDAYKQGIAMQNKLTEYKLGQLPPIEESVEQTKEALKIREERKSLEELLRKGKQCV